MTARLLVLACALAGCQTLDPYFYNPTHPVDGYSFDTIDPDLDGELTDPHASIIPAADREEGMLSLADGTQIHYVLARHPGATEAILYSHGNSDNLGHYWDRAERLWSLGYHVLIYDYPGYGLSTGTPSEPGVYASAVAALDHLRNAGGEIDPAHVWLYGYSLGGAPTYELAARAARGEIPAVRGVITESTFCSVQALVNDGSFMDLPASFVATVRYDSCAKIATLTIPVLLMHGTADDFVVPRHATLLHEAAPSISTLEWIDGANHSNLPLVGGAHYDALVQGFVR